MTGLPRRRRADAFDAWLTTALDGSRTDASGTAAEQEFGDLRPLLLALRDQESVVPRPEFVTGLRTTLMERARTELPQAAPAGRAVRPPAAATSATGTTTTARHPRRTGRERWVAAAVTALALSGVFGGSAIAAQGALPGDPLYPLKRVIEDAQVGLQGGALDRGEAQLAHAGDRLDELGRLRAAGATDTELLGRTLDAFTGQTEEATATLLRAYAADPRPATVADLRDFAASSTDTLEGLRTALPTPLTGALDEALDVVAGIDARALDACPTCSALPALALLDPSAADADPAATAPSGTATPPRDPAPADSPTTGRSTGPAPGTGRTGGRPDGARATDRPGAAPTAEVPAPGGSDDPAGTGGGTPSTGGGNGGGLIGGALGTVGGVVDGLRGDKAGQGGKGGPRSGGGSGGSGGTGSGGGLVGGLVDGLDGVTSGLGDALGGR